ncbi:MAG: hypothetical protein WC310_05895 [Patescibacteria group bacterium]
MKKKSGRPGKADRKKEKIVMYCTGKEKSFFTREAERLKYNLAEYLRVALYEKSTADIFNKDNLKSEVKN